MNEALFQAIAIVALLVGNMMLVALGFLVARLYFSAPETEAGPDESADLRRDMKGVVLALVTLGERLAKLETHIGQFREHAEQLSSGNREAEQKSFKIATKMALQGADVDEIIEICGLTRGEAELIRMLHAGGPGNSGRVPVDLPPQLAARLKGFQESEDNPNSV